MNRKALVSLLLMAILLAVAVVPAGAASPAAKRSQGASFARIAAPGGVLRNTGLSVKAPTLAPAVPLSPWTPRAPMVVGVDTPGGAGFVVATKSVYVPGGFTVAGTLHDRMQTYDALANAWTNEAEVMPNGPWADSAVCTDPATGKVYVVNGIDGFFLYASLQIYDSAAPLGARWSSGSFPMLATGEIYYSQGSGCGFLGGMLYLFGGYAVVDPDPVGVTEHTWQYDPATDTWTDTGDLMIMGRLWGAYGRGATALFAVGGTPDLSFVPTDTNERYTVAGGWVAGTAKAAGQGRLGNSMSVFGSNLIEFGGAIFDPVGGTFVFQVDTLVCGANGGCAAWGPAPVPGGKQLATPRWFQAGTGAGVSALIGFVAGGHDGAATISSAEKLP